MKKLLITLFIIAIGLNNLFGQQIAFEFTATMSGESSIGSSYTSEVMKTQMNVNFKDGKLLMVYKTGKVFLNVDINKVIVTKKTVENGKISEINYALEYKNKNNFTGYILYKYKYDSSFGEYLSSISIPYISNSGMVFLYNDYSN